MNKKKIGIISILGVSIICGISCYAVIIEPAWLKVTRYDLSNSQPTIAVAHLSDFHVENKSGLDRVKSATNIVKMNSPDLIVITGDFIVDFLIAEDEYLTALRELVKIAPTVAIAGNHDGGYWAMQRGGYKSTNEISTFLAKAGVTYLENSKVSLKLQNRAIEVYGAGDLWAGYCKQPSPTDSFANPNSYKILLTHNPDSKYRFEGLHWNLMLSGHTHGGQIVIPLIGAPFVPIKNKRLTRGLFLENGRAVVVSAGIGSLHSIRFNSRPEIVFIKI